MRHRKTGRKLNRNSSHRIALMRTLAISIILHESIKTTLAKAKAIRQYIEPLITKSKDDTTHNRRIVFKYLKRKEIVTELFRDVAVKVADRPGGYIRIIKLGNRKGDNAEMAMVELVDYNEVYNPNGKKKKKTRRRGGSKSAVATPPVSETKSNEEE